MRLRLARLVALWLGGSQGEGRFTTLKRTAKSAGDPAARRLGSWVFGARAFVATCDKDVVFVTYRLSNWQASARGCGAVLYVDTRHGASDERDALRHMENLPQTIGLLYVGNWRGKEEALPPLDARIVAQVRANVAPRPVVRLYWPEAFTSQEEDEEEESKWWVGGGELLEENRETLGVYVASPRVCARAEALRTLCEAVGRCGALSTHCARSLGPTAAKRVLAKHSKRNLHGLSDRVRMFRNYRFVASVQPDATKGFVGDSLRAAYEAGAIPILLKDVESPWTLALFNASSMVVVSQSDSSIADRVADVARNPEELRAAREAKKLTPLGERFVLRAGSPNLDRIRDAVRLVFLANATVFVAGDEFDPAASTIWSRREAAYGSWNAPETVEIRVVAITSPRHAAERSAHLSEIFELFERGFRAKPEFVDAVFFHSKPRKRDCGWLEQMPIGTAGVLAAHREAWKHYLNCSTGPCDDNDYDDTNASLACYLKRDAATRCSRTFARENSTRREWAVVFEDDAMMPLAASNHADLMILEIARQLAMARDEGADLLYLGSCGAGDVDQQYREKNWLCTHSYAVTPYGAQRLLEYVKFDCDPSVSHEHRPPLDWQMRDVCRPWRRAAYLPDNARMACGGVHSINPLFYHKPPDNITNKTKTHGLFFQYASQSLRAEANNIRIPTAPAPGAHHHVSHLGASFSSLRE
ncbi:hypothetical protein CTAYLR_009125 [Chrysophaeum taylorii]|uniref:Exostosin GT47 domain-containing protein n=1 Tax=Chrysophaeum taylorii TaxID=2483200 RepID=A0AAD7UKT5_9STRA|nr:hypothetical protein CTAYLR_009125 [Chrysophaeum taylorii]